MKLLQICSSLSRLAGGPARSVQGLVAGLESAGVETWLLAIKPLGDPWVSGVKHYRNAGKMNWFGLQHAIENVIDEVHPDLIQIHSIWQWSLHLAVRAARKKHIPYIMTPRGTIEKWSLQQKTWKKRLARWLYQDRDFHHAIAIHCTAESEAAQARLLYPGKRIILSPNGVNVPEDIGVGDMCRCRAVTRFLSTPTPKTYTSDKKRRALFVSRMHPKKGVLDLVKAWAQVRPTNWELELVYTLATDTEREYEQQVRQAVREFGIGDSVICTGSLMDEQKWEAYGRADLFVLASYSENFGIVVAEALWAGVPVITTKGTPWSELESQNCGWWVDVGADAIAQALLAATSTPTDKLREMGQRGHELVKSKYLWPSIGLSLKQSYTELLK